MPFIAWKHTESNRKKYLFTMISWGLERIFDVTFFCSIVWSIKIRAIHNLSLWLCEYFWIILLYGQLCSVLHFKGVGMRNLQYEIKICQKSHNKVTKTVFMDQTLILTPSPCIQSIKNLIFFNVFDEILLRYSIFKVNQFRSGKLSCGNCRSVHLY